jgi:hypothetical protein
MERSDMATATFTKWMVGEGPGMAGVVGGAVGEGDYAGKVLDFTQGPTTVIEARYQFNGSKQSFTALVHVEQTGPKAVISGVVTDGWGKATCSRGNTPRSSATTTGSPLTAGGEQSTTANDRALTRVRPSGADPPPPPTAS